MIGSGGMDGLLDSLSGEPGGEPAFRSTGKATRFLLQSQLMLQKQPSRPALLVKAALESPTAICGLYILTAGLRSRVYCSSTRPC